MGSIAREIRLKQKAEAEAAVETLVAKLKAAGLDEKQMKNDAHLRQAKALVRKTLSRIAAIDAREVIAKAAEDRKAAGKPEKKAKKSAAPAEGKSKSKEKKEKKAK